MAPLLRRRRSRGGSLKVVTTRMKAGYLRKNGVPYSADAVITEYLDRFEVPGGDSLLVVSTEVVDPTYLAQPFWTTAHFKKLNDCRLESDSVFISMTSGVSDDQSDLARCDAGLALMSSHRWSDASESRYFTCVRHLRLLDCGDARGRDGTRRRSRNCRLRRLSDQ